MKILLPIIILITLFMFSGCKGRDMPLHPAQPTPLTLKDINLSKLTTALPLASKPSASQDTNSSKVLKEETIAIKESNISKTVIVKKPLKTEELNISKVTEVTLQKEVKPDLPLPIVKSKEMNVSKVSINIESNKTKIKLPKVTLDRSTKKKDSNLSEKLYSTVKSTKDIPIIKEIGKLKNISIKQIPFLRSLSSLTKYLPQGQGDQAKRIHKRSKAVKQKKTNQDNTQDFTGGMISENLDMGRVDLGENGQYLRLIFNTYKYEEGKLPTELADHSGVYTFTYDSSNHRIIAKIDGYKAFSGLMGDQSELYKGNSIVKTIHVGDPTEDDRINFIIELKQDAKINVFELHKPARIVIDIVPMYRLFGGAI